MGQTPLALAACTNQPDIVTLLMDNSKTNIKIQDSYGNTVLHALVTVTMDQEPHNAFIIQMYDKIIRSCKDKALESKKNKKGLTSMQLAVTEGKLEILKYILNREIKDDENRMWSWKITDWSYGPVSSIFYDLEGVDTSSKKSILEMLVYNTDIKDRHEMLNLEPLHSLLQMKWDKFARHMFLLSFLFFFIFDIIFTCLFYLQRKDDKALKLSQQNRSAFKPSGTKSWLQVLGHVYVLTCSICIIIEESFLINRLTFSDLQSVVSDAWFNIIFITQAVLVILSSITYMCGIEESLIFMVIAITLGWTNMLYYTRGFQSLGIYSVMVQKVILNDVSKFLLVYLLFLLGFGVALASLIEHCAEGEDCSSYGSFRTAIVELFKLTLGLGDLEMQKDAKYPTLFLILLIIYVISTFVLLLNMLIALMSETVDNISKESENIWRLQRASTILKFEKTIKFLFGDKFRLGVMHNFSDNDKRLCLRISKVKWSEWHRAVTCVQEEGVTQSKVKEADGFSSITAVDVSDRGRHPIIVQENEEDSDMEIFSSSEIQNY
ncbi:transient receptor potential cation channel subfamily V member 3-like [Engystomops pustulosus]|uniref:transient receptor potential cation channel subfamily V member 3-like n=1 Tax=Engystomops pustulosus TaxID=76066 RepID=UPI003AFAE00F